MRLCILLCFSVLLLVGCSGPGMAPPEPPHPGSYLDLKLTNLQTATSAPGLVALVQESDGNVYSSELGIADLESGTAISLSHQFFSGSCAKMFVAVIMLQLLEEGLLDLEDSLSDYVEWPNREEITLRMLLNHTSGIPDYLNEVLFYYSGIELIDAYSRDWTPEEYLELVRNLPTHSQPGQEYFYSNSNYLLLGLVIEHVTGVTLAQAIDQRICQPLELNDTYLYTGGETPVTLAKGYSDKGWFRLWDQPFYGNLHEIGFLNLHSLGTADTSLISTAGNLLAFHRALRSGELISTDSLTQMHLWLGGGTYGLGYALYTSDNEGLFEGHLGRTLGYSVLCLYHPESDSYVVVMANIARANFEKVLDWGFR